MMGQQFVDVACHVSGQTSEHVLQVRVRVVAIELRRLDEAGDRGRPLAGDTAPANSQFFLPVAQVLICCSSWLLSIGKAGSSR